VEDLYLERVNNGGYDNITIISGVECWVKNVYSYKTKKWHVRLNMCYACVVRDSIFNDGHDHGGDASYGVGLFDKTTDCLIENNIFYRLRHSMIIEYGGCGNVFGYNYSKDPINEKENNTDWLMADMSFHGGHPYMNLFESNIGSHMSPDNTLGSSRHNTFFRNHATRRSIPYVIYHRIAADVHRNNLYENFVGNILGDSDYVLGEIWRLGCESDGSCNNPDPRVQETILRHGNYNYVTGTIEWDPNIEDRDLPASFYLKSKPPFFGDKPWPIIGPDLNPMVGDLPAKKRFELEIPPESPKNLRIIN
jgi:hypothetical protein